MRKKIYPTISLVLVAFFLTATVQGLAIKNSQIITYGKEAEMFVSEMIENTDLEKNLEQQDNIIIIVSDMKNADAKKILELLKKGNTLVAMNLPKDNKLVAVPTIDEKKSQLTYKVNSTNGIEELVETKNTSEQEIYPKYWISVIKYDTVISSNQFLVMDEDTSEKRELIMTKASEALSAPQTLLERSGSWQKRWEDYTLLVFGDENSQYYIRHEIYQLDIYDDVANKEYWRVDSYMDHLINDYEEEMMHCGPYIKYREIKADANSAAEIYRYNPITTVSDTTVTVGIGFTVSYQDVGFNINYGWVWNNPGVSYTAGADYYQRRVTTLETFRQPDYTLWPYYQGPCAAAYNSYTMEPSTVMRTNVGSGFNVENLESTWTLYDDHYYWQGATLMFNRDVYDWTENFDPTIASIF